MFVFSLTFYYLSLDFITLIMATKTFFPTVDIYFKAKIVITFFSLTEMRSKRKNENECTPFCDHIV